MKHIAMHTGYRILFFFHIRASSPTNVGIDSAILMNKRVWEATGHVKTFNDPLIDCKKCGTRHRADKLIESPLFRPPHGQIKIEQYRELSKKYTIVMWDVITRDYNQKLSPEKIFGIVKKYTRNGSIIVFHDSKKAQKNVLSTLPKALQFLKNEGFQFATLN